MARTRHALRRWWPVLLAVAAVGGLVVAVNPADVAGALRGVDLPLLVPFVLLTALALAVQGVRWHFLLAAVGARIRMLDSVLISVAGQGITVLLPLGDLTRAIFATEVAPVEFADVVATVTVQELTFTLFLLVSAGPVVVERHQAAGAEITALVGVAAIAIILLVPAVFQQVHRVATHTPVLRRYITQIDELQHETVCLLHDRRSMAWSLLDLCRVVLSITAFWVLVRAVTGGGGIGWASAAFVLAIAYIGGAVSLIPGGVGANEASTLGLLYVVGVHPAAAAAIAVLQRLLQTGTTIACALIAYALARRRHPELSSITAMRRPDPGRKALRAG